MAAEPRTSSSRAQPELALPLRRRLTAGGTTGNERLTAATGVVLVVLLAIIGLTLLRMRTLLWVHLFVGLLLIGPVALKMASTGYRFARYYTHNSAYRLKGPPAAALRALAPAVVLTTVIVFASGVWLLLAGPGTRSTVTPIHKVSFIAWLVFTGLHVLGHLSEMRAPLLADYGHEARLSSDVTGRAGRTLALGGALVAGAVLAVLLIPEFATWMHWNALRHAHGDH
jgi:hypothetical protein